MEKSKKAYSWWKPITLEDELAEIEVLLVAKRSAEKVNLSLYKSHKNKIF